jgi:hypothetical protein
MRFSRALSRGGVPFALLAVVALTGCSDDESPTGTNGSSNITVPQAWAGTWQVVTSPVAPGPGRGNAADVSVDPLCGGLSAEELFGPPDELGEFNFNCTGSWTDNAIDVTCTGNGTFDVIEFQCTFTFTSRVQVTRNGDSFSGTQSMTVDFDDECLAPDIMEETTIDGVRLDTEQFGCDSNLDEMLPTSWGGLWNIIETPSGGRGGEPQYLCPGFYADEVLFGDVSRTQSRRSSVPIPCRTGSASTSTSISSI